MASEKQEARIEKDPFEDYEPFGEQWKKELMRMNKEHIVELFAKAMNPKGDSYVIVRQDMTTAIGKITFADNWQQYVNPGLPLYPLFFQGHQGNMKMVCYYLGEPGSDKLSIISTGTKTGE